MRAPTPDGRSPSWQEVVCPEPGELPFRYPGVTLLIPFRRELLEIRGLMVVCQ